MYSNHEYLVSSLVDHRPAESNRCVKTVRLDCRTKGSEGILLGLSEERACGLDNNIALSDVIESSIDIKIRNGIYITSRCS